MRSLSNLIKAGYIHYTQAEKKVIDSDSHMGSFQGLSLARVEELPQEDVFPEPVDGEPEDDLEDEALQEQIRTALEEARQQAEAIKAEAAAMAEQMKKDAWEEGRAAGYEAGLSAASEELARQKEQLNQQRTAMNEEYEKELSSLEPQFVTLLIAYLEKLTGILCEDQKDVILFLVSGAMRGLERSRQFLIRVSAEDFSALDRSKETLRQIVGEEASIELIEDESMKKNQCTIETDDRIIDCGLDEQLKGLTADLKLLARI